jgi:hypothetical protein
MQSIYGTLVEVEDCIGKLIKVGSVEITREVKLNRTHPPQ